MAKLKVKDLFYLEIRITEHSGLEWEAWRSFCSEIKNAFPAENTDVSLNYSNVRLGIIAIYYSEMQKRDEINKTLTRIAEKNNLPID